MRKFTVGTASILVGATLLFGIGEEAKADEQQNNSVQSQSNNLNDDGQSEEAIEKQTSTEKQIVDQESTEEIATNEQDVAKEEQTEEAPKAEEAEKATTEEASTAEETDKVETEEALKAEETDKVETEEAPTAEETNKAATINPLTGEKVGEGDPTTEVTKEPTDEIVNYAPEIIPHGTHEEIDPNLPEGETKVIPGKDGLKDPETGEIIEEPQDEVIIHGAKEDTGSDSDSNSDSDMGMGSTDSNNNDGNGIAKAATTDDHDKSNNDKKLPDTGEQPINNGALFGGLFAGVGSLLLLGRRKKDNKENN
ncbi:E domain-containing protein [Mammaliicoccus sciuri]|uniref:E domain-containing protein n=1 Tax=Mammaliicoccus sciuri TaxID=1296 RepID=UPI0039F1CF8A|nr:E domain-containing protein [Mammaliicoccus sciuri]